MRKKARNGSLSVHAIAGTHVVLLGFAIERTDHTEDERYGLSGLRTFERTDTGAPGLLVSTLEHPFHSFLWGDYTAKTRHSYTYRVVALRGKPKKLEQGEEVEVRIDTADDAAGEHAVSFNRGGASSQTYSRKFGNKAPGDVPNGEAWRWLSRGLEEVLLAFIGQAKGRRYALRQAPTSFSRRCLRTYIVSRRDGAAPYGREPSTFERETEAMEKTLASASIRSIALGAVVSLASAMLVVGCGSGDASSDEISSTRRTGSSVVGAGDIASCASSGDEATATLLAEIDGTVITLGDNAYERGSAENYRECYEPTWGLFKDRTRPVPGNHEYETEDAEGYFGYFGEAAGDPSKGYYSYDLGRWHLVALNSNKCLEIAGCHVISPQVRWLKADLAANDEKACTLAYFHHPRFSSGEVHGSTPEVEPLWEALYEAGADVVLSAHEHNYERFAPQDPNGRADPERGIREFVAGTGGKSNYQIETTLPNSEVHNDNTYGVLKLNLHPKGYDWRFVPVEGETFTDSGHGKCH